MSKERKLIQGLLGVNSQAWRAGGPIWMRHEMTDIVALGRPHPKESPLPLAQERAVYFLGAKSRQRGRGTRLGRRRSVFLKMNGPALSGLAESIPRPIGAALCQSHLFRSRINHLVPLQRISCRLICCLQSRFNSSCYFKFFQLPAVFDCHGQNKPHSPPGATDSTQSIRQWKDQQTATMGQCGRRDPSC